MTQHPDAQTPGGNRANAEETTKTTTGSVAPALHSDNAKAIATLTEQLVLRGFTVQRLDSGNFLVSRWGLTKHCPDAQTLAGFAHQVGAC